MVGGAHSTSAPNEDTQLKLRFRLLHGRWLLAIAPLAAAIVYALVVATPEVGAPPPEHGKPGTKLWSFGFVGDTQLGEQIVEDIFSRFEKAKVEFVVHLGDMVDDADDDAEWDELLRKASRHRIRLMPVAGNHDRLTPYADRGEVRFRQYFPDLPKTFYHFRHRDINFLMLNSEYSFVPASEQGEFVRWQLANHPGTTVVCLHRPVFTCGGRDLANQFVRRVWLHGALKSSDTALVLSGHHHYYDRTKPLDGITYVVSGGGSPKLYDAEQPCHFTAAFQAERNHYGLVDVYLDHLEVRVLDLENRQLDSFALELKPTGHRVGGFHNRWATELPPLDKLPDYQAERLEAYTAARHTLPRPW